MSALPEPAPAAATPAAREPNASGAGAGVITAMAALMALALATRAPSWTLRRLVEGDGVHYAALARDLLAGDWSGVANPYWSNLWPAAIAMTSAVTGLDVVAAGRAASLASGVLLPVLVAVLGRRLFGPAAGWAAGLATVAHPWLLHFSTLVFTESFFAALLTGLLWAGWRAARSATAGPTLVAGVLAGLALLTRPEAWAAVAAVLLLMALGARPAPARRRSAALAAAVLGLAGAALGARALLVHRYYSVWDFGIGSKGTANLILGLASDEDKERVSNEITPEGENLLDVETRTTSVWAFTRRHPGLVLAHVVENLRRLAASARRVMPPLPVSVGRTSFPGEALSRAIGLLSAAGIAVAGLGLAAGLADPERRGATAYLATAAGLYLAGLAPLNVHDRVVLPLVPVFLVFLGHGLAILERAGTATLRLPSGVGRGALASGLVGAAVLCALAVLHAPALAYGDDPPVQKDAGEWLAARFDRRIKLMTPCPAIAFYFYDAPTQDNEIDLPWASWPGVLAFARAEGVEVIAAPEWHLQAVHHPAAAVLLDPQQAPPELLPVATIGTRAPYRVFVYRLAPAGAAA